jgi:hypothetical protein
MMMSPVPALTFLLGFMSFNSTMRLDCFGWFAGFFFIARGPFSFAGFLAWDAEDGGESKHGLEMGNRAEGILGAEVRATKGQQALLCRKRFPLLVPLYQWRTHEDSNLKPSDP